MLRGPSWPGLQATVGGSPVEVSDVAGTLAVVRLPAGLTDAEVTVAFRPRGEGRATTGMLVATPGA